MSGHLRFGEMRRVPGYDDVWYWSYDMVIRHDGQPPRARQATMGHVKVGWYVEGQDGVWLFVMFLNPGGEIPEGHVLARGATTMLLRRDDKKVEEERARLTALAASA